MKAKKLTQLAMLTGPALIIFIIELQIRFQYRESSWDLLIS